MKESAYADLSGIVPTVEDDGSVSLENAAAQAALQNRYLTAVGAETEPLLSCMAQTNRFRQVRLSHYADVSDEETKTQFAAVHIELLDGTTYIAFCGTDDTFLGWQEDFSMSFQLMPAQQRAAG